jgi:hypothetical protein
MAKDALIVALEGGAGPVLEELVGEPARERDRALGLLRLRRVRLVSHPRLADAELRPVRVRERDVAPAQAEYLPAALSPGACHCAVAYSLRRRSRCSRSVRSS